MVGNDDPVEAGLIEHACYGYGFGGVHERGAGPDLHQRPERRRIEVGAVDEPHVVLAQMSAAPAVIRANQIVVVIATAVALLGHAGQQHRVVEHRPHARGVAGRRRAISMLVM